jgi:hypothetical protein
MKYQRKPLTDDELFFIGHRIAEYIAEYLLLGSTASLRLLNARLKQCYD